MRLLLVICLTTIFPRKNCLEIAADCDVEFASSAAKIAHSRIDDPLKLVHIEAILSSCNKSRMQKITEISVFLLNKGTFPSRTMDDIQQLAQTSAHERKKRLNELQKQMPSDLHKAMADITEILLNNSLSGNEKVESLSTIIDTLPREHRKTFEGILNQEANRSQMNFVSANVNDYGSHSIISTRINPQSNDAAETDKLAPHPFFIKSEEDKTERTSGILTTQPIDQGVPASTIIRRSDMVPLETFPGQPISPGRQQLFLVPPATFDQNIARERLIDVMTKNRRESTDAVSYPRLSSDPIIPVISSNSNPHSVGNLKNHKKNQPNADEMDDADLLNPRSSILSDAVRLLQKTIPLIKPERSAPINHRYAQPYTFPLSEINTAATNGAVPLSERRIYLPSRDDPPSPMLEPISPVNGVQTGLNRFDSHLTRFASGVPNRVIISTHSSELSKDMENMERNRAPIGEFQSAKTNVGSDFTVYPDHRAGLFPKAINQARYEPRISPILERQHATENPEEKNEKSLSQANILLENFPAAPYSIAQRPKQSKGHDLLDTDRLGSWSMGRFDKEEPYYPTPEPAREFTTIIAILQERTTTKGTTETTPFSEKTTILLPEFPYYRSPQEITGSYAAREVYNIKHHGRPRFVKIDLLNE